MTPIKSLRFLGAGSEGLLGKRPSGTLFMLKVSAPIFLNNLSITTQPTPLPGSKATFMPSKLPTFPATKST